MLIDSFLSKNKEFVKTWNGLQVFKINDNVPNFNMKCGSGLILGQRLPYKHTCLQFNDSFMVLSENKTEYVGKLALDVYWSVFPMTIDRPTGIVVVFDKGSLQVESIKICVGGHFLNDAEVASLESVHREIIQNITASVLVFLDFISCTNVVATDIEIDVKIQKSRSKKGKLPLLGYKVLKVCLSGPAKSNSTGRGYWTNRVHLCRGHIAEYGMNGKGKLFGKYSGRFWIPPHVKGDPKAGVIVKDYELET